MKKEKKMMKGIDVVYCNFAIQTVLGAYLNLIQIQVAEALDTQKIGKKDTLGMDAVPENSIREAIMNYFHNPVLVTEETDEITRENWPEDPDPMKQPLMFFADPMDRSSQFKEFLQKFPRICGENELSLVEDIINHPKAKDFWEKEIDNISPAVISGATIATTCVSKGQIVVSVIMNIITRMIFVACSSGIYAFNVPGDTKKIRSLTDTIDLKMIEKKGKKIIFKSDKFQYQTQEDFLRFVAFVGKTKYPENLSDSGIMNDHKKYLYHNYPGGPSRILYLSHFQSPDHPIGAILSNGEKIGEWIHWLAYVKNAKNQCGDNILRIYEIYLDRPWVKDGILMSPTPSNSIFRHKRSKNSISWLNISRLRDLDRPSHFRSMILVTNANNSRVRNIMQSKDFREVSNSF